ncbi:MAG: hypothetical protein ACRD2L_10630, partial [Terriglobia bacterium]
MADGDDLLSEIEAESLGIDQNTPDAIRQRSIDVIEGRTDATLMQRIEARAHYVAAGGDIPRIGDLDIEERNRFLSEQRIGQNQYVGPLGEPGSSSLGDRFDLGLSDTYPEMRAKFLKKHPTGDFIMVAEPPEHPSRDNSSRGGNTILFRVNEGDKFAEFDAPALQKFELLGDLADVSGELPAAAMMAAVTLGESLAAQLLMVAAGSIIGDTAKEVLETARGYQEETFGDVSERIAERAGVAAVGGAVTTAVSKPINAVRTGAFKLLPGAVEAQRSAASLYIRSLLPTQISANPLVKLIGGQSQATTSTLGVYMRGQQQDAVQALLRLKDDNALRLASGPDDLIRLHNEAVSEIKKNIADPHMSLASGGRALQAGLEDYVHVSGAVVDSLFTHAKSTGTPIFDISRALAVSKDIRIGVVGQGKETTVRSKILGPDGTPVDATVPGGLVQLDPAEREVIKIMDGLEALDPS